MNDNHKYSTQLAVHEVELKHLSKYQNELSDRFIAVEQSTRDRFHELNNRATTHEAKITSAQEALKSLTETLNIHIDKISKEFKTIEKCLTSIKALTNKMVGGVGAVGVLIGLFQLYGYLSK